MKEKQFEIDMQKKEDIIYRIERYLEKRPDLLFAYVHGSFISQEKSRDIDVAIYLKSKTTNLLQDELDLEAAFYNLIK